MTREEAKEFAPILQAFADGKAIQFKLRSIASSTWKDVKTDMINVDHPSYEHRIKPEPRDFWLVVRENSSPNYSYDVWSEKPTSNGYTVIHVREVL